MSQEPMNVEVFVETVLAANLKADKVAATLAKLAEQDVETLDDLFNLRQQDLMEHIGLTLGVANTIMRAVDSDMGKRIRARSSSVDLTFAVAAAPAGKPAKKKRKVRDPNMPKRPPSGFLLHNSHYRPILKKEHPEDNGKVLMTKLGAHWRGLGEEEKKGFEEKAKVEKAKYAKAMEAYFKANPDAAPASPKRKRVKKEPKAKKKAPAPAPAPVPAPAPAPANDAEKPKKKKKNNKKKKKGGKKKKKKKGAQDKEPV